MKTIRKKFISRLDQPLIVSVLAISAIGVSTIYSATHQSLQASVSGYPARQMIWMLLGLSLMVTVLFVDTKTIRKISPYLYPPLILILIGVLLFGKTSLGAKRWFALGPLTVQPSEFAKIVVIMALASYLSARKTTVRYFSTVIISLLIVAVPTLLVMKQPDLGTAMTFLPIFLVMVLAAGARVGHLVALCAAGLSAAPALWFMLKDYQKSRIMTFLNPESDPLGSGYSIIQSKIAVGSGELLGKGWMKGTQTQLNFLPEQYTDFIFSAIGEEWGFVGAVLLILLFAVIIARGIRIAWKANDDFGYLLAVGIVALISFHVFVNIGMAIGFLPVTGLPLPFVTYGGSSILAMMLSVGLLLNIRVWRD
ncbi:MAG: rod shape-determining protein RodA [bacterium]